MPRKKKQDKEFTNIIVPIDADELVSSVTKKREWFMSATRTMRRQWLINAAFSRGQQYVQLMRTEDRLIALQPPGGRKMVTDDMIGVWKDHMTANIVTALPQFEAQPDGYSGEQILAARFGTLLLNHYWEDWRFIEQFIQIAGYILDFGNAFTFMNYEVDYMNMISKPVLDSYTGEQVIDQRDGTPLAEKHPKGDVTSTVLAPHCVCTTLDTDPVEAKPWVIIQQKRTLDYFKSGFDNGDEVTAEDETSQDAYDISKISDYYKHNEMGDEDKTATELIYLQKPCDAYPDGIVAIIAGKILLKPKTKDKIQPWPFKKLLTYPIEHFHYPKEAGEFFARSKIERQIPLQKLLNLLMSILAENVENTGYAKQMIPNQAGVPEGFVADINQVVRYNEPFKPWIQDIPPLPQYIEWLVAEVKASLRDLQSYHGASMGSSVSGVRSDLHAQNLQDQDLLPLNTLDKSLEVSFSSMGEKILLIACEKLVDERMISYTGMDSNRTVTSFKGSMLGDVKKVKVKLVNTWMRNKNSTIRNIFEFFNAGMITDMYGRPDSVRVMKMVEFALPDSALASFKMHSTQAHMENQKLMSGEFAPVLPWQVHNIHIQEHEDYMNSGEFMALFDDKGGDNKIKPETQKIIDGFIGHLQQHEQAVQQALQQMMQPAQPTQTEGRTKEKPAK
jgi:hypothetical protein